VAGETAAAVSRCVVAKAGWRQAGLGAVRCLQGPSSTASTPQGNLAIDDERRGCSSASRADRRRENAAAADASSSWRRSCGAAGEAASADDSGEADAKAAGKAAARSAAVEETSPTACPGCGSREDSPAGNPCRSFFVYLVCAGVGDPPLTLTYFINYRFGMTPRFALLGAGVRR